MSFKAFAKIIFAKISEFTVSVHADVSSMDRVLNFGLSLSSTSIFCVWEQ